MTQYVTYLIAPQKRDDARLFFSVDELQRQESSIKNFLKETDGLVISTFVEVRFQSKHRQTWPELKQAIDVCKKHGAQLLIAEIRNLTNHDSFNKHIIEAIKDKSLNEPFELVCLDQPFIQRDNFEAIALHSQEKRKYHSQLVKEGITHAHPGNPKASQIINLINKTKTDNSIIFAMLMQPIIQDYQEKGFSQRKMVTMLNEEGYAAPAGGKWVLSQLQKILERMRVNASALNLEPLLKEYKSLDLSHQDMANKLNKTKHACPTGKTWTEDDIAKLILRKQQLDEIIMLNALMIDLLPMFSQYHIDELTDSMILDNLQLSGVRVPQDWLN